jgi:hypothetical protein
MRERVSARIFLRPSSIPFPNFFEKVISKNPKPAALLSPPPLVGGLVNRREGGTCALAFAVQDLFMEFLST